MNVGAVVADHGSRISVKSEAASLIRALVNVEDRGKNRGACGAARSCLLTRASHIKDGMPAAVAPSVSPALEPPLSVEATPPLAPVLAPAFELWKLQPAAFVGQDAP